MMVQRTPGLHALLEEAFVWYQQEDYTAYERFKYKAAPYIRTSEEYSAVVRALADLLHI